MNVYYDNDADLSLIKNRQVAIIGYGAQGHAHANNLRDSAVSVIVGARRSGHAWQKAELAGFVVKTIAEAIQAADFIMVLLPDESQADVYYAEIEPYIKKGSVLAFAHGFAIHFGLIKPRNDIDVVMIAPKGSGHLVRSTYQQGGGVPSLIAVHQDTSGQARDLALSYAAANGGTRGGVIETSFREETETDLFSEQTVLCGGTVELVKAGFETLVEAGYAPELAYFECLHELKLVVDLLYEGGIGNMNYVISNNAEYGEYTTGPRIINAQTKATMRAVLAEIQSGEYAKRFMAEYEAGSPTLTANRRSLAAHPIEQVGTTLREMMPWIKANKLVDQTKN